MTGAQLFVVRARKSHGTATYNCPNAEWALKKLGDFQAAGHDSISITGPDGQPLTEADLRAMVEGHDATARGTERVTADLKS
ncbi:hypothetical protein MKL09_03440 [Methylobacterium sp. J-048]|uniref:hypothetical protein n=1 Tax=Methylobacterium sp. J-048 TaxID=2836635 RepID=UPI001FBB4B96|nr:hypothetical protein [Methylobacterium sp. J-048]MCJ2055604.1 hypothetical protein [Methylobacterium sp. J-048]